jgi:hypothetical protein
MSLVYPDDLPDTRVTWKGEHWLFWEPHPDVGWAWLHHPGLTDFVAAPLTELRRGWK